MMKEGQEAAWCHMPGLAVGRASESTPLPVQVPRPGPHSWRPSQVSAGAFQKPKPVCSPWSEAGAGGLARIQSAVNRARSRVPAPNTMASVVRNSGRRQVDLEGRCQARAESA